MLRSTEHTTVECHMYAQVMNWSPSVELGARDSAELRLAISLSHTIKSQYFLFIIRPLFDPFVVLKITFS